MSVHFPFTLALFTIISVRAGRVLLALFALQLDAQPFTVGLLAGTFSVPPMLLAYKIGKLTDRYGARWPLTVGITGSALGILVPFLFPSLPALFIAAFMNGVAFAFFNVSLQNAVGLLSTTETRVKNFAGFTMVVSLAQFIGPIIIGFSVDHLGAGNSCLVTAAIATVAITLLALRGGGLPAGTGKAAKAGHNMLQLLGDKSMQRVLIIGCLMMTGQDLFFYYMPVYAHNIGLSASTIGIILGIFSGAGLLVRIALPRLIARLGMEGVLALAFFTGAASYCLMPLLQDAYALCTLSFIFGLAMNVGQPITMTLSFTNAADGRSGEAMGLRQTVNHATRVAGPLFFGALGSMLGAGPGAFGVFWLNAVMLFAGGRLSRKGKLGSGDS